MPTARVAPDLEMHYLIDDFTDPWRDKETVLLLHGNAESGAVWFGWVPYLARRFRVVRPDMRGFGHSTPMPRDYRWPIDTVVDDYLKLLRILNIERFHLVGAKISATVARRFAARCPDKVLTLTLAGAPAPHRKATAPLDVFDKHGMKYWARNTMGNRLGSTFPQAGVEWWIQTMGQTAVSSQVGFLGSMNSWDVTADLPRIACPTLVITTEKSTLGSVEETRAWQEQIAGSKLLVFPGDSFHVAATDPDRCARETLNFITS